MHIHSNQHPYAMAHDRDHATAQQIVKLPCAARHGLAVTFCSSASLWGTAPGPAAASSAAGNAALLVPPAASHDSQMFTASATVLLQPRWQTTVDASGHTMWKTLSACRMNL
jgi:hypothetical protein